MTSPQMVGRGNRRAVLDALVGGRVVAIPADGGYHLAVCRDRQGGPALVRALDAAPVGHASSHVAVGRRAQAIALAAAWSKETALLTDRMWPGPLTVVVRGGVEPSPGETDESGVHVTMPASRWLRAVCRQIGPLTMAVVREPDGRAIVNSEEMATLLADSDVALIVDGGTCHGPGPTVVDCTTSPPVVLHLGAIPESYVDAALMMGNRRRKWFTKGTKPDHGTS